MTQNITTAESKAREALANQAQTREEFVICRFLKELRFRRRLWGIDELDAWKAMEKLANLYEDALTLERSRRELAQKRLEVLENRQEARDE